jgi:hypothetical protein
LLNKWQMTLTCPFQTGLIREPFSTLGNKATAGKSKPSKLLQI